MFETVACQRCGHLVRFNPDLHMINVNVPGDSGSMMGWCEHCGSIYIRNVAMPLQAVWQIPRTLKAGE